MHFVAFQCNLNKMFFYVQAFNLTERFKNEFSLLNHLYLFIIFSYLTVFLLILTDSPELPQSGNIRPVYYKEDRGE